MANSKRAKNHEPMRVVGHYFIINGEWVPIDPFKTDLPDRCKLALAEMETGIPHRAVNKEAGQ